MGIFATLMAGPRQSRATPENPSFDLNSPEAWDMFTGGASSAAGVAVNFKTANSFSPWWRAIGLISKTVAKLPLFVYKRNGEGKDRAADHPAYPLLRYDPNPWQTDFTFKMVLTGHAVTRGNGYAYIDRDTMTFEPIGLCPLDPEQVTPLRVNGVLWYQWTGAGDGVTRKIPAYNVLHVMGFSNDGLCGLSVVDIAKEAIGLGIGQQRLAAASIKNGARPGVILQVPGKLQPEQVTSIRSQWNDIHGGPESAHKTAVLDNGMVANTISFSPEDQQFIEQRGFQVREVANFTGVPPHKLGDTGRQGYASLEQENQAFLDDGLDPWLCAWESECRKKLLTEEEKADDSHVVEFLRAALVQADLTARANYFRTATGGRGWMTINEVRGKENMNPDAAPDSSKILTPLNMGQGGGQNEPADPAATNKKPDGPNSGSRDALTALIVDAQRRARKRIATQAVKASRQPRSFNGFCDAIEADHGETVRAMLLPVYRMVEPGEFTPEELAAKWIADQRAQLLEIAGECRPSQLADAIERWANDGGENGTAISV